MKKKYTELSAIQLTELINISGLLGKKSARNNESLCKYVNGHLKFSLNITLAHFRTFEEGAV